MQCRQPAQDTTQLSTCLPPSSFPRSRQVKSERGQPASHARSQPVKSPSTRDNTVHPHCATLHLLLRSCAQPPRGGEPRCASVTIPRCPPPLLPSLSHHFTLPSPLPRTCVSRHPNMSRARRRSSNCGMGPGQAQGRGAASPPHPTSLILPCLLVFNRCPTRANCYGIHARRREGGVGSLKGHPSA